MSAASRNDDEDDDGTSDWEQSAALIDNHSVASSSLLLLQSEVSSPAPAVERTATNELSNNATAAAAAAAAAETDTSPCLLPNGSVVNAKNTLQSHSLLALAMEEQSRRIEEQHEQQHESNGAQVSMSSLSFSGSNSLRRGDGSKLLASTGIATRNAAEAAAATAAIAPTAFYKQVMQGGGRHHAVVPGADFLRSNEYSQDAPPQSIHLPPDQPSTLAVDVRSVMTLNGPFTPPRDALEARTTAMVDAVHVLYEPNGRTIPLPMQVAQGVVATSTATADDLHAPDGPNSRKSLWGNINNVCASKQCLMFALGFVVAAATAIIVVPPLSRETATTASSSGDSTSTLTEQVVAYINTVTLAGRTLTASANSKVLEERALFHLLGDSPLFNEPPKTSSAQAIWRQRYAMATLWSQNPKSFSNTNNECLWKEVKCDDIGEQNVVVEIDWSNVGINGPISADLGLLSHLVRVDFSKSNWSGTLPESVVLWTNLEKFDAWGNFLTGTLPATIGAWSKVEHFNVRGNTWTGALPSSIGQWANLSYFNVESNAFNGTIPTTVGKWTKLQHFYMQRNRLTGSLPESIANWDNIEEAFFHFNTLTGAVPSGVCRQATNSTYLYVDCNVVYCTERCCSCIGAPSPTLPPVTEHVVNYINNITLTGRTLNASGATLEERALFRLLLNSPLNAQPDTSQTQAVWRQRYALATLLSRHSSFANTMNECGWAGVTCERNEALDVVTALDLLTGDINGPISADLGLLSHLVSVNFAQSAWTSAMPESLGRWTDLVAFDAWGNSLTGALPSSTGAWTKLEHFNAWGNAWTGSLPSSIGQWTNLRYFNAESNMLRGRLPSSIGSLTRVEHFNVQENSMTGPIPFFHFNDFTGTAPSGICNAANVTKLYADCGEEVACSRCWTSTFTYS